MNHSGTDDDGTEGNDQNEEEHVNSDNPDESSDEDKGSNYSLGDETETYLDPEDDGDETEQPTPSSPHRTRSQTKSGNYGILVSNVYSYVPFQISGEMS